MLVINCNFINVNNEREVDFINCVIWWKVVELLVNYVIKGILIGLIGCI